MGKVRACASHGAAEFVDFYDSYPGREKAWDLRHAESVAVIGVGTDARYVPYGYNHVVVLRNGCSRAATCNVSTDVNPKSTPAIRVDVAAGTTVEVLTFTASPAQVFTAHVTCKLR